MPLLPRSGLSELVPAQGGPPREALPLLAFHQACPLPGASVCSPLVASSALVITVKEV